MILIAVKNKCHWKLPKLWKIKVRKNQLNLTDHVFFLIFDVDIKGSKVNNYFDIFKIIFMQTLYIILQLATFC